MLPSLTRFKNLANRQFQKMLLATTIGLSSVWVFPQISPQAVALTFTSTNSTEISEKNGFDHESSELIADVLYLRPSSTYKDMDPNGAYRVNQDYALGLSHEWYIEEQRFGADALISGLLHHDQLAMEAGFKMFDWGFAQQQQDGSFGDTGDAFHSTSLFMQSVAYAILTLQESPVGDQYTDIIEQYASQLHHAAHWMIQADTWEQGLNRTEPYTHRYYIIAAALGLTGKLTGDQTLIDHANQVIVTGLAQQRSNGVNPELGGFDSSYQMAGALYAMRWLTHFATDPLAADVANMLDYALLWEDSVILETGAISIEENTRTQGQSSTRTGAAKGVNHREIIYGFAYWFSVTEQSLWESNAIQVASYYYADDQPVILNLEQLAQNSSDVVPPDDSTPDQPPQELPESSALTGLFVAGLFCYGYRHRSLLASKS